MRFTTIAVLLLAASAAHAKPGQGRGNSNGQDKDKEKAEALREIAKEERKGADDLEKGQQAIAAERQQLRGSIESCGKVEVQNGTPLRPKVTKEDCPEVWKKFYEMEEENARKAFKNYHPGHVDHDHGRPIHPKKPDPADPEFQNKMAEYAASMKVYVADDAKFEKEYFATKYHPKTAQLKDNEPNKDSIPGQEKEKKNEPNKDSIPGQEKEKENEPNKDSIPGQEKKENGADKSARISPSQVKPGRGGK